MNSYWCSWEKNWLGNASTVLSASSQTAEQPVSNLVSPHKAQVWRALSATPWFRADFATPRPCRHVSLHGMKNLTQAATLRWRLSNVGAGQGELLDTRIAVYSHLLKADGGYVLLAGGGRIRLAASDNQDLAMNVERNFDQFAYVLDAAINARYSQVDLLDPGNGDGYLDIGFASIGAGFETSRNFDYGLAPAVASTTQGQATPGGQTYFSRGVRVRSIAGGYRFLTRAEALGPIQDLLHSADENNALFVPFPNDPLHQREMIYGLLPKQSETPVLMRSTDGLKYGWSFTLTERL